MGGNKDKSCHRKSECFFIC